MIFKRMEKYRYKLLFFFIILFLTLPAFITGPVYEIILVLTLSFIILQSIWVFTDSRKQVIIGTVAVMVILLATWYVLFKDESSKAVLITKTLVYIIFFGFVLFALFRMIIKSKQVTADVIFVCITIYMIMGIIGGSLAYFLQIIYNGHAFKLPDTIQYSDLLDFTYFGFVTMSTLGYGDIVPLRQESQALSYLLAIFGQLYVAIIVAIIVSKYISHRKD